MKTSLIRKITTFANIFEITSLKDIDVPNAMLCWLTLISNFPSHFPLNFVLASGCFYDNKIPFSITLCKSSWVVIYQNHEKWKNANNFSGQVEVCTNKKIICSICHGVPLTQWDAKWSIKLLPIVNHGTWTMKISDFLRSIKTSYI